MWVCACYTGWMLCPPSDPVVPAAEGNYRGVPRGASVPTPWCLCAHPVMPLCPPRGASVSAPCCLCAHPMVPLCPPHGASVPTPWCLCVSPVVPEAQETRQHFHHQGDVPPLRGQRRMDTLTLGGTAIQRCSSQQAMTTTGHRSRATVPAEQGGTLNPPKGNARFSIAAAFVYSCKHTHLRHCMQGLP